MLCFQSVLYCIVLYNDVFTFLYVAVGNKLLLLLMTCSVGLFDETLWLIDALSITISFCLLVRLILTWCKRASRHIMF